MIWATVITDASYYAPPRNRKAGGAGGWAAWIKIDGQPQGIQQSGELKHMLPNSTFAEMYAALNGIWLAVNNGAQAVLLRTDCMAVIHLVQGQARKNGEMYQQWQQALGREDMRALQVLRAKHVKGHTAGKCAATWVNNWADQKAKAGQKKARKRLGL